jgi:hypothetical protein
VNTAFKSITNLKTKKNREMRRLIKTRIFLVGLNT